MTVVGKKCARENLWFHHSCVIWFVFHAVDTCPTSEWLLFQFWIFMVSIFVSFFGVNLCPFLFHITLICNLYFLQFDWNDGFNYERWIAHVHSPWVMGLWCLIHCMRNKVSIFCLCSLKFCCLYILFHYYYAS